VTITNVGNIRVQVSQQIHDSPFPPLT